VAAGGAAHRQVVNGILWKLRTGAPWRDLPEQRYGPWQTCYDRFVRWRRDGTWERLLADAQTKSDAVGEVEWLSHASLAGDRRWLRLKDRANGIHCPAVSCRPTRRILAIIRPF
jgi:transposase